jgi:16S rRNA (uracil1498-N3)-methyltransferase
MTRRRWIADEVSGSRAALVGAHADHLARVLRARVGQDCEVVAAGILYRTRITSVAPSRVEFELGEPLPAPVTPRLTLAISIFKFDRMEWAIEKCTELGAWRMVPAVAERTEAHLAAAAAKRCERWRRIALQASEQSRRLSPPEICTPVKLKEVMSLAGDTRIVLAEGERDATLRDVLGSQPSQEVVLAFGPEGGWTEDELERFRQSGWQSASLGRRILRSETAAIAATAVALSEFE